MLNEWWKDKNLAFIYGEQNQATQEAPNESIGQNGFTGKGPDGVVQPDRRVPGMGNNGTDKHEGEFNFDADSTQAIGPDVLKGAMQAAKTGSLDLNKMRESIGQSPKTGYQAGGLDSIKKPVAQDSLQKPAATQATQQTIGAPSTPKPMTQPPVGAPQQPNPMAPLPGGQQNDIINIDPMKDIKIDPIKPDGQTGTQTDPSDPTDYLRDLMGGDNPYIDAIKKQAAQDVGGAGAAGTAALKQEAAQRGMSPEQIASMGVTRQRDVDEQTSDVVGDIATAEAQMGVQAARDVFNQDMASDKFEYQQGMDQYNNQLAQGDYTGAADSFNKMHGTNIDFSKAIDAENLSNFNNAQNGMTQAIGNDVPFDDWLKTAQADGTFDKLNMTEGDVKAMYENMRLNNNPIYQASKRYQDLVNQGIITQDQMDDILAIQSHMLSNPDGYSVTDSFQVTDENGKEIGNYKAKEDADAFAAENPGSKVGILDRGWVERTGVGTGTGTGDGTAVGAINQAQSYLDQLGVESSSSERIQEYLDEHGGKIEGITAKDWNNWNNNTGSPARIRDYFSGDGMTEINPADKKMLGKVADAQKRIDAGKGTPEDDALIEKLGGNTVGSYGMSADINSATSTYKYRVPKVGSLQYESRFNKDVYGENPGAGGRDNTKSFSFNKDMQDWAKQNAGRMIEIDGKYYKVADDPIKKDYQVGKVDGNSGNDKYSFGIKADAIVVTDPETGKQKYVTYGVYGSHWDQDRDKGKYVVDGSGIKVWD